MRSLHWRQRYRAMEKALPYSPAQAVVFLGDSLTEQFDLDYFFKMPRLVNHGVSGDHIDGARERLHLSKKTGAQQLWLMIGINDLFDGRDDAWMFSEYQCLLEGLDFCPRVMVQSLLPTGPSWQKLAGGRVPEMNRFLEKESRRRSFSYIDLHTPFRQAIADGENLFQDDDIHLNDRAYTLWSSLIRDSIYRPGS